MNNKKINGLSWSYFTLSKACSEQQGGKKPIQVFSQKRSQQDTQPSGAHCIILRTGEINREARPANLRKSRNVISKQDPQCQSFVINPTGHLRGSQATGRLTATIANVVVSVRVPQSRGRIAALGGTRTRPVTTQGGTHRGVSAGFLVAEGYQHRRSLKSTPHDIVADIGVLAGTSHLLKLFRIERRPAFFSPELQGPTSLSHRMGHQKGVSQLT